VTFVALVAPMRALPPSPCPIRRFEYRKYADDVGWWVFTSLPFGLMHAGRRVWAMSLFEDDDGVPYDLWWPGVVLAQDMLVKQFP